MNRILTQLYSSPCGDLILGSFNGRLCLCDWEAAERHRAKVNKRLSGILNADFEDGTSSVLETAAAQLDEYFCSMRKTFSVPLLFAGTDFQKKVWQELLAVPFGNTISYRELAIKIGSHKAVRAVANANSANALSIFAPCHRVIGSDNSLTGYAGGVVAKKFLLNLEKA